MAGAVVLGGAAIVGPSAMEALRTDRAVVAAPIDAPVELPSEIPARLPEERTGDLHEGVAADEPDGAAPSPTSEPPVARSPDEPECIRAECLAWTLPIRDAASSPGIGVQDEVLLLVEGRHLTAIDVDRGEIRWRTPVDIGGGRIGRVDLATTEVEALVFERDGMLRSIGLEDGKTRWREEVEGSHRVTSAQLVGDHLLAVTSERIAGGGGQVLAALDPATGEVRWREQVEGQVTLTAAGAVVSDPSAGSLRGIDQTDGSTRWEQRPDGGVEQLLPFHGWVLVRGAETTTVVDAEDGEVLDTLPTTMRMHTPGTARDALVLVGDQELSYLDLDHRSWTVELPGPCCAGVSMTTSTVRVLRTDGVVTDVDRSTGRLTAEWTLPGVLDGDRSAHLLGSYLLTGTPEGSDLAIHHVLSGTRIALLPGTRFPIGLTGEGGIVLVGGQSVAALEPLPEDRPPSGP